MLRMHDSCRVLQIAAGIQWLGLCTEMKAEMPGCLTLQVVECAL